MAPTIPVFTFDTGFTEPNLRSGSPADWTQYVVTTDAAAPASALSLYHGQAVMQIVGGTGLQSNRRDFFQLPGTTPFPYWQMRSRWASPPPTDGIMEHGYAMNLHLGADGRFRSIVLWHFIPGILIAGIWDWPPDASSMGVTQTTIRDQDVVSASARASNVVTATVPTGAASRWRVGDLIVMDVATASFDGVFLVTSVADTQIQWSQVGANESGGAGTVTIAGQSTGGVVAGRNFLATDASRTNGIVTTVGLPLNNPFQVGDWITVDGADPTYDMVRTRVTNVNPFTGQISWSQQGVADDTNAGQTIPGKVTPYYVNARLLPGGILQAKTAPDYGVPTNLGGAANPDIEADSPWESPNCTTWDFNKIAGGAAAAAQAGVPCLLYAHGSFNSPAIYDNVTAIKQVA